MRIIWWEWGRKFPEEEGSRIYVNCKTRHKNPFFASKRKAFDGSVLGLFPKQNDIDISSRLFEELNKTNWEKKGFVCDGRLLFTQRQLRRIALFLFRMMLPNRLEKVMGYLREHPFSIPATKKSARDQSSIAEKRLIKSLKREREIFFY